MTCYDRLLRLREENLKLKTEKMSLVKVVKVVKMSAVSVWSRQVHTYLPAQVQLCT